MTTFTRKEIMAFLNRKPRDQDFILDAKNKSKLSPDSDRLALTLSKYIERTIQEIIQLMAGVSAISCLRPPKLRLMTRVLGFK